MAKRDYYDVLGVSKNANADEIRKAYRKLVRQYHPDANRDNPKAAEKFNELQEAYDVISDPAKREKYNQFGHAPERPGMDPEAFRRAQQQGGRSYTWQAGPGATVEDFDFDTEGGGIGSIFEQFFGGGGRRGGGRSRAPARRGADVEYPISLTFEQAARGVTLPLQINRGGKLETIEVKIPAGVKDASRVRIKGRGEQAGGEPGDLFIITTVQPHDYYRRDGLDILLELPVSLYEALNGAKVTVPTLDGPVTLTIPPGTNSHAKLRIKGRGIQRGPEQGDQFVIVRIVVPKELDAKDKKVIEELAAKHPLTPRADVKW